MNKLFLTFVLGLAIADLAAQSLTDSITSTFMLGEVVIKARNAKDNITSGEISKFNKKDASEALSLLPSVSINVVGSRNEAAVFVRGFDIRSIPIYIDGVPVYMPFDGYADLSRFTLSDLSKIEVSKGYSSLLYGPNALGGTINMISTQPAGKIDFRVKGGLMSGTGFNNSFSIGTKKKKFFAQISASQLDRDFISLSADFDTTAFEKDHQLDNSYRKDRKISAKFGFTPNLTDSYTITYSKQLGEKGNPVYLGSDPKAKVRYWQWPYWNKESVYFISFTKLKSNIYLKSRVYYDQYKNKLSAFDDGTYSTQTKKSSFNSLYNDQSAGTNIETGKEFKYHTLKAALQFKNDYHQSNNVGDLAEHISDNIYSIGLEDVIKAGKAEFTPGISYNYRQSMKAENSKEFNADTTGFLSFPKNNNSAFNAQFAASYGLNDHFSMNAAISFKTRFATMKDRYSYKIGTALPNPDLKSEEALNADLGADLSSGKLSFKPGIFYSRILNTIQLVSNVQEGISQMQNTGRSQFYGADFSIVYKPFTFINALLNYTFVKRENLSNPEILFTDVPDHQIVAMIDATPLKNLDFNVNGMYYSERNSTSYGIKAPQFVVFNTRLAYEFKYGISVETGINNIFDKNYFFSEGYPEAGRNFYLSLNYHFLKN